MLQVLCGCLRANAPARWRCFPDFFISPPIIRPVTNSKPILHFSGSTVCRVQAAHGFQARTATLRRTASPLIASAVRGFFVYGSGDVFEDKITVTIFHPPYLLVFEVNPFQYTSDAYNFCHTLHVHSTYC
jgi:hypothetical protein